MLSLIVIFALLGSIGALLRAALLLLIPERVRQSLRPWLLSFAVGTLLGGAFLGLIPKGIEQTEPLAFMATLLVGFVAFFALEKLLLKRHSLVHEPAGSSVAGPLILIGDAFHNFVDGAVIAAAFITSTDLGITVALAVIAHEIPQEIGEFAILLENGYSRTKALLLNALSAIATLPGAVLTYFWLGQFEQLVPHMLAISAASFIYVAAVDLVPSLHKKTARGTSMQQIGLLCAGMVTIGTLVAA